MSSYLDMMSFAQAVTAFLVVAIGVTDYTLKMTNNTWHLVFKNLGNNLV